MSSTNTAKKKSTENKKQMRRYLVRVNLISVRMVSKGEIEKKQYYFEVGKKRRQRTPTNGYLEFHFDHMADMKEPLTLYTEFISAEIGREVEVIMEFKERNRSKFKVDDANARMKLSLKVGEKRRAYTVTEDKMELRLHLSITETQL